MYADVIVDIESSDVDRIFEYSCDDGYVQSGDRVVVPFGTKRVLGIVVGIKRISDYPPEKIKPLFNKVDEVPALTVESLKTADFIVKKYRVTRASALRLFLPSEMRRGTVREKTAKFLVYVAGDYAAADATLKKNAVAQHRALAHLHDCKRAKAADINKLFGRQAVNALISRGFLTEVEEKTSRSPYKTLENMDKSVVLTPDQRAVITSVNGTDKTVTLVHGVTGSGKTEVYLSLIRSVLESGRTAIMLVPEISLTPQMLRELRQKFGDACAILHSGLTAGERFDEWWRLRSGDAKIAVGARSAIFAPLENVGLIVIDEEHDGSYSSESSPRYETQEIAKFRAQYNGAKIVFGSATPSVDTYMRAISGEYNFTELKERINGKPLPEVEIADMRKEVRRGNNSPFSSALKAELEHTLSTGNQAIVFLNRRGYSQSVICTECGYVPKCEACDVALTYHMDENSLKCHYCNAKYKMLSACPECGGVYLRYGGTGTQRVVSELKKLFPTARILRMDRDTTQTKEGHFKILGEFAAGKADILVGTQMIAKGHDFPSVTLVGILDADMSLHFSDYRSGERTFQLITQVAGRSGRADTAGKVVLQTYQPENNVLRFAVRYDYKGFYEHEIALRKATGFPPFTDIIRILVSSADDEIALAAVKTVYEQAKQVFEIERDKFAYFGCMKAPIKRIQNKFRYQVLMRCKTDSGIADKMYGICAPLKSRNILVSVEINPNNLT